MTVNPETEATVRAVDYQVAGAAPNRRRAGQLRVRVRASKTNASGRREDLRLLAGPEHGTGV